MAFERIISEEPHESFEDAPKEIWDRILENFGPVSPGSVVILLTGDIDIESSIGETETCSSITYIGATMDEIGQDLIDIQKS